jgi:hypothetical protein
MDAAEVTVDRLCLFSVSQEMLHVRIGLLCSYRFKRNTQPAIEVIENIEVILNGVGRAVPPF